LQKPPRTRARLLPEALADAVRVALPLTLDEPSTLPEALADAV